MNYTGIYYFSLPENDDLARFYENPSEFADRLKENQYLILENDKYEPIDFYKKRNGWLERVSFPTIGNRYENSIKPRNPEQRCAIDLLKDFDIKVKILRGVYGSGKDFLMFNEALSRLEKGATKKIIFTRPHVSVGGLPEVGFLPGDLDQKLGWTLGPLLDKVGGEEGLNYLIDSGQLQMIPLNYIRGRSFEDSIIYMTEGQNMTSEIAKLLLGRVGEGSELWINADTHQVDKRLYAQDNGVNRMVEKLSGNKLFGYVYLPQTERSEVARMADLLD